MSFPGPNPQIMRDGVILTLLQIVKYLTESADCTCPHYSCDARKLLEEAKWRVEELEKDLKAQGVIG